MKLSTLFGVVFLSIASFARAAPVVNWVSVSGDAGFSNGSESTSSPVSTDADADVIAANISAVTLADGDYLTLTGSVSINNTLAGNQFRIGLFDGPNPVTLGVSNGYSGIWAEAGTTATGRVKMTPNPNTNQLYKSAGTTTLGIMSNPMNTPVANTTINFSLSITRNGADLNIDASFSDGASYNSTLSLTNQTSTQYTYDSVAFLMGGSLNATQATFSNITVTTGNVGSNDSDNDGMNDTWETANGLNVGVDDSGLDADANGGPDGLTNLQEFQLGTDPQKADTDGDAILDGAEVANGTDPNDINDPGGLFDNRLFGIDFNRDDQLGSPTQSMCRVISGSAANQAANQTSYTKIFGSQQITVARPDGQPFEFRGANGDGTRAIPGGDVSRSFMVADFIGTRGGQINLTLTNLPAGAYIFRSFHLEPYKNSGFSFAQGSTTVSANTIEAHIGGVTKGSVQPTALGSNGLNTTFINDLQIPTMFFSFIHDGSGPLTIELHALDSNGADTFLFLNGFEIFTQPTP